MRPGDPAEGKPMTDLELSDRKIVAELMRGATLHRACNKTGGPSCEGSSPPAAHHRGHAAVPSGVPQAARTSRFRARRPAAKLGQASPIWLLPMTGPCRTFRKLAQANRLANARLHRACATLDPAELTAPRPAFFGTIQKTLNHILMVDRFYLNALLGHPLDRAFLDEATFCPDVVTLTKWQAESDLKLLAHVESLTPVALVQIVAVDRGARVQHDRRDDLLSHLFQHQTHHRGQVHGMLSATPVKPPQLDEFIVGDDASARAEEMALLSWTEADLMR